MTAMKPKYWTFPPTVFANIAVAMLVAMWPFPLAMRALDVSIASGLESQVSFVTVAVVSFVLASTVTQVVLTRSASKQHGRDMDPADGQ